MGLQGRVTAPGNGHRDQTQGHGHGHDIERGQIFRREKGHGHLPDHQTQAGHDHIEGKNTAALLLICLIIEPAFQHHVLRDHRRAGQKPQEHPDRQQGGNRLGQNQHRHHGGGNRIRPDMPYLLHQLMTKPRAQYLTRIKRSNQQTDPDLADPLLRQVQGNKGVIQPRTHRHQQGGKIQ